MPAMKVSNKVASPPKLSELETATSDYVTRVYEKNDMLSASESLVHVVLKKLESKQISADLYLFRSIDYLLRKSYQRKGFYQSLEEKDISLF